MPVRKEVEVSSVTAKGGKVAAKANELVMELYKIGHHSSVVDEVIRNPYIEWGYRNTKTIRDTFLTLFSFHNESMSIWSHLIGFVCVLIAGYHISQEMLASSEQNWLEVLCFESFILCAAVCLLLSAIYHWFGCISEAYHNCLLRIDVTGIGILVTGSFIPAVYYGFYCTPTSQAIHAALTVFVFVTGLVAPWIEVKIRGVEIRPYILASLVVLGVVPFGHWFYITPAVYRDALTSKYIYMFMWYGMGFLLFVTKMPEKLFPKSFIATQVFASHSLWHMCVLFAVYVWFHFLLQYQALLKNHGCSAYGYTSDVLPVADGVVNQLAQTCSNMVNGTCASNGAF